MANKIVLLMFFSERCGFCKTQDPIIEDLRKNMDNQIDIIKIDIYKDKDIAKEMNVDATPTIFILRNNNVFKKFIGLTHRNELETTIKNALK
jgi:thioredoxin 1